MSALYDLVNAQRQSMIRQYRHFTSSIEDMNSITAVLPAVVRRVTDFSNALVQVSELRVVLFDALHGRLSDFLVPQTTMARTLRNIVSELWAINNRLHLTYVTTSDAYQATDLILSRTDRDVYITVTFPVTPLHCTFTLYGVQLFAVAMPDNIAWVTV